MVYSQHQTSCGSGEHTVVFSVDSSEFQKAELVHSLSVYAIAPRTTQVQKSVTYRMTKNLCDSDDHGHCTAIKEEVHDDLLVTTKEHLVEYGGNWSIFEGNS